MGVAAAEDPSVVSFLDTTNSSSLLLGTDAEVMMSLLLLLLGDNGSNLGRGAFFQRSLRFWNQAKLSFVATMLGSSVVVGMLLCGSAILGVDGATTVYYAEYEWCVCLASGGWIMMILLTVGVAAADHGSSTTTTKSFFHVVVL